MRPEVGIEEWWLNMSYPKDGGADADGRPDDAWQSHHLAPPGFFPPFDVSIDAVCMKDVRPSYKVQGVAFTTRDRSSRRSNARRRSPSWAAGRACPGRRPSPTPRVTEPFDNEDKGNVPDDGWTITVANPTMAEMDVVVYAACV